MAKDKKSYPTMPANNWWALRKKFRTSLPKEVTTTYLASALKMGEKSARNNILPGLRITGLIDEADKPTDRAVNWRDDKQYPQVCKEIREEVYPQELLDLAPDLSIDRATVQTWFAGRGIGTSLASKHASFYLLILEADPLKESDITTATASTKTRTSGARRKPETDSKKQLPTPNQQSGAAGVQPTDAKKQPSIHVDVQIHISHEAKAEQIDQIFASMAKHLKEFF